MQNSFRNHALVCMRGACLRVVSSAYPEEPTRLNLKYPEM